MSATSQLQALAVAFNKHMKAIDQLTLTQWVALASQLGVASNDRGHAAKKLAIREVYSN